MIIDFKEKVDNETIEIFIDDECRGGIITINMRTIKNDNVTDFCIMTLQSKDVEKIIEFLKNRS